MTQQLTDKSDHGLNADPEALSEEQPEHGRVSLCGVVLSEADRWIDEGTQVIRSTEFEVVGHGDDLNEAVEDFIGHALDYHGYLARLVAEDDATEHEARVLGELGQRLVEAGERIRRSEQKRADKVIYVTLNLSRRQRRQRPQSWLPSPRNISSRLSHA